MKACGRKLNHLGSLEGSASKVSFDAVIPLLALPVLLLIASRNLLCTLIAFASSPLLLYYVHRNFLRLFTRTKFFYSWTVATVVALITIYELSVVPLLEILPEENLVLITCAGLGIACAYKTRQSAEQLAPTEPDEDASVCNLCRRRTPSKAFHCRVCQTCVYAREYHCKWLDCCVGANNLQWYVACLLFSATAFVYYSNLALTTICHPFVLIGPILLLDDCTDAYYQFDNAVCFVSSVYSLLVGLLQVYYLLYHLWFIRLGTTASERRFSKEPSLKSAKQLLSCC